MPKHNLLCAIAAIGLLAGPSYSALAASNKTVNKSSAQTTNHVTRTAKPPKSHSATTGNTTSKRTANGQHIPETTAHAKKVKESDNDLTCMLFPSLCVPLPKH
jgi:hypothetical protein